jgi:2,4-dienoyl-CoA reductase-like NADH-dependent reductase (Old Yellow Enzyme family)/thioredoxin reductase
MADFSHVLSPIRIGGVTLPNRVVRPAHVTMLGIDHPSGVSDRLIAYHEARARGGVGLTVLEIASGHPSSPAPLNAFNPALQDGYQRLVAAVRPHGMHLFQQIWHGGHNAQPLDGSAPWSASDVPSPRLGLVPTPMTKAMIDAAIESYVVAARTAKAGGIEGVEVHAAHGYLLQQFLSPVTNRRDDDYGGSAERRRRLLVEVLAAVRAEVGSGFPVGVRVGPDCVGLVQTLEAQGLVDFVSISQGSYFVLPKIIGAMHEPVGYQLQASIPIAAAATTPTIVTGRFRTLEEADQVIRLGQADCVGMVRATIADPALVAKSMAGKVMEVRPCIACNQSCIGNQLSGKVQLGCTVNPAVAFDAQRDDSVIARADIHKRVLIVGGGPAGLEAARVAALRGHDVILCEADKSLGGQLRLAARAPYRASIGDVAVWLADEVARVGVDVRLNTYIDADDLTMLAPDAVILATGAMPRTDGLQLGRPGYPIPGNGDPPVFSSFDVFSTLRGGADGVFIVDDDVGHYEGVAVAEFLLDRGATVNFVTRHATLAPLMEPALSAEPALERLSASRKFQLHLRTTIAAMGQGQVELAKPGGRLERIEAEAVVLISHNVPAHDLHQSVAAQGFDAQVIGDARSPRFLETAIREGRLAGLAI